MNMISFNIAISVGAPSCVEVPGPGAPRDPFVSVIPLKPTTTADDFPVKSTRRTTPLCVSATKRSDTPGTDPQRVPSTTKMPWG